jgi:pyruvate formate lyase activating enzyme
MQHKFALSFLRRCRSGGINTAVETEAFCTFDVLSLCAGLCDTLFTDVKAWQPSVHRELTGVDNSVVLGNLSALSEWMASAPSKPAWIIRLPFLPGVNFFKEDMKPLAGYLRSLGDCLSGVEILPFHNFGEHKYAQTGLPYSFLGEPNLRGEAVEAYAEELRGEGVPVTVTQW